MYLKDLKVILNECTPAELKQIIVKLYKTMPKEIKELGELDAFIRASNKQTASKTTQQQAQQMGALLRQVKNSSNRSLF